ncbi:MAG: NUDIX domain-containing protein [Eubacterium sp.]|nr:NUDIX domain-containing protein [Eubacterium sp.]
MNEDQVKTIYDSQYMKLYDLQYEEGCHYYMASRRDREDLPALAPAEAYSRMLPDAVSCFVVLRIKGQEPRLFLSREYRYPAGQYLLSVPAGLIDKEDRDRPDAVIRTAVRELEEETGITFTDSDEIKVVNPFVFSTPGLTDEGNALVFISINRDRMPEISQTGATGAEKFRGYELLDKKKAEEYLIRGRDDNGIYYPLYTWAALMFFMGVTGDR